MSTIKPAPSITASFVVGNTYKRIAESEAKYNRKGSLKKIHDWVLYVDIVQGDHRLIESVRFVMDKSWQPQTYTCKDPVTVSLPDGSKVMRFRTRQQSTGPIVASVKIVGCGGTECSRTHPISIKPGGRRMPRERFIERGSGTGLEPKKLANSDFGIELELSCKAGSNVDQVAEWMRRRSGCSVSVIKEYAHAHDPVPGWKLVHDGSIVCSPTFPNCSKFELVSPILRGENGLKEAKRVIESLRGAVNVSINKSMGFHLHISVEGMPVESLKKVCQNYVKYEDVIDSFMPPSRRSGSRESKQYFKSNKQAVTDTGATTNLQRNQKIASCESTEQLGQLMNPTGRYYKLNLQNLITRRQPTIEFRQHSGTSDYEKISSWIRFCMALVKNAARFKEPSALKKSRSLKEQFDMLFEFIVKDRALQATFRARQTSVLGEDDDACCSGCAHGRPCAAAAIPRLRD